MSKFNAGRARTPDQLAVLDIETIAPPVAGEEFPPWATHTPVVASILLATRERYGQWRFELESIDFLAGAAEGVERVSHLIERRDLVTFFGRGFDVGVLAITAMKHQRGDLAGLSEAWQAHRFSGRHHDLADIVGNYGGARGANLEMLCAQLGIPAKENCGGGDVAELVAKRQFRAIQDYCEADVVGTAMLFACVEGFLACDPGYAATLISQLSRWIADSGLTHLKSFERILGHDEYDRQSLKAVVEAGITALEHRQHLEFVRNVPGPSGAFASKASDF